MKTPMIALTAAAAIATALSAVPAAADNIGVQWRDLNLETVEGQRTLDRRIDSAARKVCGMDEALTGTRFVPHEVKQCFSEAKASAESQVAAIRNETRLGG